MLVNRVDCCVSFDHFILSSTSRSVERLRAVIRIMTTRKRTPKERTSEVLPELSETELDLLSQLEHGYQLETDTLGSNPVLRRSKDGEVVRAESANRNTIKALEERGLIAPTESREPLTIVWRLKKKP